MRAEKRQPTGRRSRAERASVTTVAGRARLAVRPEPYWLPLDGIDGGHVGYRAGPGTWVARHRDGDGRVYHALGKFEDHRDAVRAARAWLSERQQGITTHDATVATAADAYCSNLERVKSAKVAQEARARLGKTVTGRQFNTRTTLAHTLARVPLAKLRPEHIEKWRDNLIRPGLTGDELRNARASANREMTALLAALNYAFQRRMVYSDLAWKTVKKFSDVQAILHGRVLTAVERRALRDAATGAIGDLIEGLMLTGARPIELVRAKVADYAPSEGTLRLTSYKGQSPEPKRRVVPLRALGAEFLVQRLAKGKPASAPLFARYDGKPWQHSGWDADVRAACAAVGLAGVTATASATRSSQTHSPRASMS